MHALAGALDDIVDHAEQTADSVGLYGVEAPMVVIRWKDIFESLEAAADACERVAHVLEGIAISRRR